MQFYTRSRIFYPCQVFSSLLFCNSILYFHHWYVQMSGGDLGVSAFPEGESIFTWIGTIEGGKGTMYEGLSYKLSLRFPLDYPFKPPQVKFETMCFHPNVDQYGNICLDILQVSNIIYIIRETSFWILKMYKGLRIGWLRLQYKGWDVKCW